MAADGRWSLSLSHVLTILGMTAMLGAVWASVASETADMKRRLSSVESRQAEDRSELKMDQKEIKDDVKRIREDVQTILIKMQRSQERERPVSRERQQER